VLHLGLSARDGVPDRLGENGLGEHELWAEPACTALAAPSYRDAPLGVESEIRTGRKLEIERGHQRHGPGGDRQVTGLLQPAGFVGAHEVHTAQFMGCPHQPQAEAVVGGDRELPREDRGCGVEVAVAGEPAEHLERLTCGLGIVGVLKSAFGGRFCRSVLSTAEVDVCGQRVGPGPCGRIGCRRSCQVELLSGGDPGGRRGCRFGEPQVHPRARPGSRCARQVPDRW